MYPRGGDFFWGNRFFGKPNEGLAGEAIFGKKKGGGGGASIFLQTRYVKKWFSLTQVSRIVDIFFWQAEGGGKLFLASQKQMMGDMG